eukprot:TRINITY_DN26048_c0_g1_i1.p1 TRINITY_DN26048_c0_g1~~TRINITY_DN26048_c0_g1_i1.p1  ORF type:complete len:850 (+),score=89.69 TRINITY_DN26048_c0_g1_i1:523-3072(+)
MQRALLLEGSEGLIALVSELTFDPCVVDIYCAWNLRRPLLALSEETKQNPATLLLRLVQFETSFLQCTPSFARTLAKEANWIDTLYNRTGRRFKYLALGGEPFPTGNELRLWCSAPEVWRNIRAFNLYGITEVSVWASVTRVDVPSLADGESPGIGVPLPDTAWKIVDEGGNEVPDRTPGQLFIGGTKRATLIQGDSAYPDERYRPTGDVVCRRTDGSLEFCGRLHHRLKVFGHTLHVEEVEKALLAHPVVDAAAVTAVEVGPGRLLVAYVSLRAVSAPESAAPWPIVLDPDQETLCFAHSAALGHHLHALLPSAKHPSILVNLRALPSTINGKLDRQNLAAAWHLGRVFKCCSLTSSLDSLRILWCCQLGGVAIDDNLRFTDHCADSIAAFRCVLLSMKLFHLQATCHFAQLLATLQDGTFAEFASLASAFCTQNSTAAVEPLPRKRQRPPHVLQWAIDMQQCVDAMPLVCTLASGEKRVFCGSHAHVFVSADAVTGSIVWQTKLDGRIESTPCLDSIDNVAIGTYGGCLHILRAQNGHVVHSIRLTNSIIRSSPVFDGAGAFWVGSHKGLHGTLHAVDIQEGRLRWQFTTQGSIVHKPLLDSETNSVVCGTTAGEMVSVNATTGKISWRQELQAPCFSQPLQIQGYYVTATVAGHLTLISKADGTCLMQINVGTPLFSAPVARQLRPDEWLMVQPLQHGSLKLFSVVTRQGVQVEEFSEIFVGRGIDAQCRVHLGCFSFFAEVKQTVSKLCLLGPFAVPSQTGGVVQIRAEVTSQPGKPSIGNIEEDIFFCENEHVAVARKLSIAGDLHEDSTGFEVFGSVAHFEGAAYFGCRNNLLYCVKDNSSSL